MTKQGNKIRREPGAGLCAVVANDRAGSEHKEPEGETHRHVPQRVHVPLCAQRKVEHGQREVRGEEDVRVRAALQHERKRLLDVAEREVQHADEHQRPARGPAVGRGGHEAGQQHAEEDGDAVERVEEAAVALLLQLVQHDRQELGPGVGQRAYEYRVHVALLERHREEHELAADGPGEQRREERGGVHEHDEHEPLGASGDVVEREHAGVLVLHRAEEEHGVDVQQEQDHRGAEAYPERGREAQRDAHACARVHAVVEQVPQRAGAVRPPRVDAVDAVGHEEEHKAEEVDEDQERRRAAERAVEQEGARRADEHGHEPEDRDLVGEDLRGHALLDPREKASKDEVLQYRVVRARVCEIHKMLHLPQVEVLDRKHSRPKFLSE